LRVLERQKPIVYRAGSAKLEREALTGFDAPSVGKSRYAAVIEYINLPCPKCQRVLRVRPEYVGKRLTCKQCDNTFRLQAEDLEKAQAATSGPPSPTPGPDLEAASQRLAVLEAEIQHLRGELEARHAACESAELKLKEAQEEAARHLTRVQEVERELELARGQAQQTAAFQIQLEAANAEREQLHTQLQELQGRADDAVRLEAELQAAQLQIRDLQALRGERDMLQKKLEENRPQLEENAALRDRCQRLRDDWQQLREERDQIAADRKARLANLEQTLKETRTAHETSSKAAGEEHARGEAERKELQTQRDQARQAIATLEHQLRAEQARAVAERRQWQARNEALDRERQEEQKAAQTAVDQLHEAHEAVLSQLEYLKQERDNLLKQHCAQEAARQTAHQNGQSEITRLAQELETARQQEAGRVERQSELDKQLAAVQAELEQQRQRVRTQSQIVAGLQRDLETTRTEAATERTRLSQALAEEQGRGMAERKQWQTQQAAAARPAELAAAPGEVEKLRQEVLRLRQALIRMGIRVM
jgi:chromosome segregation ATPase